MLRTDCLDHNRISTLDTNGTLPKLRILRLSSNKLQRISGAAFPNLRTLYADNNAITGLDKVSKLSKLENLSLRNQSGKGLYVHSLPSSRKERMTDNRTGS
jgi:Leucine-rich repeat (LRR) protein